GHRGDPRALRGARGPEDRRGGRDRRDPREVAAPDLAADRPRGIARLRVLDSQGACPPGRNGRGGFRKRPRGLTRAQRPRHRRGLPARRRHPDVPALLHGRPRARAGLRGDRRDPLALVLAPVAWQAVARHVRAARARNLRAGLIAAAAAATVLLFLVSRGKWSDPIIDSGREWIVPDALARGQLLYRDVVYWFGPFTPYFQAFFLRILGSDFGSLVVSGVVASAATVAALFLALRRVTDRLSAVLTSVLAVPALFFMPNAGGSILGMGYRIWHAAGFGLAAIAVASGAGGGGRRRMVAAGALAGLSGLCRTEWGLVILAAVLLARLRLGRPRTAVAGAAMAVLSYAAVFGVTLLFFIAVAGADAVVRDGHVLLTGLPEETRRFLLAYSGIGNWRVGIL